MIEVNAEFVREAKTDAHYRCWSINDDHPGMIRTSDKGNEIELEIWSIPSENLSSLLLKEPVGLCIGKVRLNDGSVVLGVLAEPWLIEEQKKYGVWRVKAIPLS